MWLFGLPIVGSLQGRRLRAARHRSGTAALPPSIPTAVRSRRSLDDRRHPLRRRLPRRRHSSSSPAGGPPHASGSGERADPDHLSVTLHPRPERADHRWRVARSPRRQVSKKVGSAARRGTHLGHGVVSAHVYPAASGALTSSLMGILAVFAAPAPLFPNPAVLSGVGAAGGDDDAAASLRLCFEWRPMAPSPLVGGGAPPPSPPRVVFATTSGHVHFNGPPRIMQPGGISLTAPSARADCSSCLVST